VGDVKVPNRYVTPEDLPNPAERFRLYTLCACPACEGRGKVYPRSESGAVVALEHPERCSECRGEGRVRELQATCESPEALGVALVTLGREGQYDDENGHPCPIGVLDTMADEGERKWIVLPWTPSPRNLTDAGRVLGKQSARKRKTQPEEVESERAHDQD
jgi:hypothetical protein